MHRKPTEDDLELEKTLNQLNGKVIQIKKEMNRDVDVTTMTLSSAALHERPPTIDGYVSPYVLRLKGKGKISTSDGQYEQIPYDLYEIPLTDKLHTHVNPNHISIKTEEATFTITYH
ncbi:hypothetical protein [Calidifontibacillus erzurumensis]|uniref:Uncharacterized protein n=1 Tax=Calidifontibacillus erzurumensis TaxID=2741433 RepID=A0A8J8GGN5_9BACI|nr:hypothetical protein [Calidifontibacillus erzurumensis]NSL51965.1 hypothetical protein [Calidifontibacillus erzurumensis]